MREVGTSSCKHSSMEHGGAPISHGSGSRPSLGFPLGTALLLLVIFTLSGIFSCCYHRDKLRRTLSLGLPDLEADGDLGPSKPKSPHDKSKQQENQSMSVIMPGDNVPKFIAMPCPCETRQREENIVELQKPRPKAPPRIAVPLY